MLHHFTADQLDICHRLSKIFDAQHLKIMEQKGRELFPGQFIVGSTYDRQQKKLQINYGLGHGSRRADAVIRSLTELVERRSLIFNQPEFESQSFTRLRGQGLYCLDPKSFGVFSPEQAAVKSGEVFNLSRSSKVDWTWCQEATSKKPILLPDGLTTGYKRRTPLYFLGSSNGAACGKTAGEARLSAVLEILERDALLFYWRARRTPNRIDLGSADSSFRQQLERDYGQELLSRTTLFYLKTDIRPTILAVYKGEGRGPYDPFFSVATSCKLDPRVAIRRALSELIGCFCLSQNIPAGHDYGSDFDQTIWDFVDRFALYATKPLPRAYSFLFSKKSKTLGSQDLKNLDRGDAEENLRCIVRDFAKNNLRLYFKDHTPADVRWAGLHVQRAISPDLLVFDSMHRHRALGGCRIRSLATKLKMKKIPRRIQDLNHFPHPLP